MPPKKIAVLGGGMSSMTAIYELTNDPRWQEKYDITLYQMGWRLGGKGASGRNQELANRIEEHGVHLWFGSYDNAFQLIQQVYKDNNRPLGKPLATWQEAFKPYSFLVLEEYVNGQWEHWPIRFPENNQMPGSDVDPPTVMDYVRMALRLLSGIYKAFKTNYQLGPEPLDEDPDSIWDEFKDWVGGIKEGVEDLSMDIIGRLIFSATKLVDSFDDRFPSKLIGLLDRILERLWKRYSERIESDTWARRMWIIFDLFMATIKGIVGEGVITKGFDVVNDQDYRAFLKKWGASNMTINSAIVQSIYGLVFCGKDQYTYEAGTLMRIVFRFFTTYKGALYWRMQAGMGDAIFAPMYEVLKKRGVKFEFFHKVKQIKVADNGKTIEKILIGRQVNLKNGTYEPLFNVKDLPCWPSAPFYDQVVEGEELKKDNIDLESAWTPWKDVGQVILDHGKDFDEVILGISIGALPYICADILKRPERDDWRKMIQYVTTTPTQAFQTWLKPDIAGMGWSFWNQQETAILGSYEEPIDSWADMSDVLNREQWEEATGQWPNNLAYFCGPLIGEEFPPFTQHDFPEKALAKLRERAIHYMDHYTQHLFPNTHTAHPSGFRWDLLVDLGNRNGVDRIDGQYLRVNIDPTAWYVLAEVNSSKHRLKTDASGFTNLFLTGDWIDNGFNAGCIEAAAIAGRQCARAIMGGDYEIKGERDRV